MVLSYRSHTTIPTLIYFPLASLHQSDDSDAKLLHSKLLTQAGSSPAMEADKRTFRIRFSVKVVDGIHVFTPTLRFELVRLGAPELDVTVGGVCVVTQEGTLGHRNIATQHNRLLGSAVDQLGDRRKHANGFVYYRSQKW